jgi:hypothetical protein
LKRKVTVSSIRSQANPWMEHTAWDKHLCGFEKETLKTSLYPGSEEDDDDKAERALKRACGATGKAIKKAMDICNPNSVPRNALFYVNRRETGAENNEKPFYSRHRADTMRKYCTVWVKLLRYIWRSQQWEDKPPYKLTQDQQAALQRVKDISMQDMSGLRKRQVHELQGELEWAVVKFWMSML